MNVTDLLKRLALGELSNLSLATGGIISAAKVPTIIQYTNEALHKLYTKYLLNEKDLILELREDITYYHLLKRFAYSQYDPLNPPTQWNRPYIMDMGREPFTEDVIKVLSVYDQNGIDLPLNDTEQVYSVFTPQAQQLQVPHPVDGQILCVSYQAKHPTIPSTDYEEVGIDLPECLHSALCAYITSKLYMHMNTAESTAKGQEHSFTFDKLCQEVIEMDLVSTTSSITNTRFQKRGFI